MQIKANLQNIDAYAKADQADKSSLRRVAAEKNAAASLASASSGDISTVSAEAKLRAEAYSSALSTPDARAEKVAAIKAQVDSGEYQIDSKKIAANLLKEDAELLGL